MRVLIYTQSLHVRFRASILGLYSDYRVYIGGYIWIIRYILGLYGVPTT